MTIDTYLSHLNLPDAHSHKGQNGKLLIVGGSELFHAASKWSLDVASKFVDMVFYSSVPANNELVQQAKGEFWNGIVIPRQEIENYMAEADGVLIGPGMTRSSETEEITNQLLKKYAHKKWVIDAGALQMINPELLNQNCIVTPHQGEFERLLEKEDRLSEGSNADQGVTFSQAHFNVCLLIKGETDVVIQGSTIELISGGNAGMTKGGTGDVLAGLVAALYCTNDALTSAVVGSYINKKAGEELWKSVGPNFNASDLVATIPKVLWTELNKTYR
ncbi:MAG TPA: NAD(P)H-hydrate dehydratase [Patescibacteria group bacterium]